MIDLTDADEAVASPGTATAVSLASRLLRSRSWVGDEEIGHLWSPATWRFDGPRLRLAIVARAWNVAEFAEAAGISRACAYGALAGRRTRLTTAVRVLQALASRPQLEIASVKP
jgi:hypothetical protein